MSWNGSGTFNRLYSWIADKAAGIDITASRMDADTDDITSAGFGNCLTRDGQGSASANLPMNGFKHTGVANATAGTDYVALGQITVSASLALYATGLNVSLNGVTVVAGGVTVTAGGVAVTAGGLVVSAGGASIAGTSRIVGSTLTVDSGLTVTAGGLLVSAGGASITGAAHVVSSSLVVDTSVTVGNGLTVSSGGASIAGNSAVTGALTVSTAATTGNQIPNLSQFIGVLGNPFSVTIPTTTGNIIIKGGQANSGGTGNQTITYAAAFPTATDALTVITGSAGFTGNSGINYGSVTASGFQVWTFNTNSAAGVPSVPFSWIAIGH